MPEDLGQKTNVIDKHPDVAKRMLKTCEQYGKEARPLMVNEGAAMSPVRPYHVWYAKQLEEGGIFEWKNPDI